LLFIIALQLDLLLHFLEYFSRYKRSDVIS